MRLIVALPLILLAACKQEVSPEEQARSDARDIAMVENAQKLRPPVEKLVLQPVSFADVQQKALSGAGCGFLPTGSEGLGPVLYTDSARGAFKLDGEVVVLAADSGSAEFPYGSREHYTGKRYDLRLSKDPGEGKPFGEEAARWTGSLIIRDRWDRAVHTATGTLECGA
jgi:hypothetical protein